MCADLRGILLMRCGSLRFWSLLVPAILWLPLAGCSAHDPAWDTGTDTEPGNGHSTPAPPPAPPPVRELVVTVSANGAITCKENGVYVRPLTRDQIVRNEGTG